MIRVEKYGRHAPPVFPYTYIRKSFWGFRGAFLKSSLLKRANPLPPYSDDFQISKFTSAPKKRINMQMYNQSM